MYRLFFYLTGHILPIQYKIFDDFNEIKSAAF